VAQEKVNTYKHQQSCIILSDEDIIFKNGKAFKALTKRTHLDMFVYRVKDFVLKETYLKLINLKHKWIHLQFGKI